MRGRIRAYVAVFLLGVANFAMPVVAALPDGFMDDGHQSTESIVRYLQQSDFMVTIPAEINFTALGQTVSSEVTATSLSLDEDEYIYVDFVSTNVGMKNGDEKVMYSFETSRSVPTLIDNKHHKILSVVSDSDIISPTSMSSIFNLTSEEEPEITRAGQYTDTLTFSMSILPKVKNIEQSVWQFDDKIDPTTLATRVEKNSWLSLEAYFNYDSAYPHKISGLEYDTNTYGDEIDFGGGGTFDIRSVISDDEPDEMLCFTYGHNVNILNRHFEGWSYLPCSQQYAFWWGELSFEDYMMGAVANVNKITPTFGIYETRSLNEAGFIDWLYENATFLRYDDEMEPVAS